MKDKFDLDRALNRGLLPSMYFSTEPDEDLKSYIGDYLSQEIAAEAAVRNLPAFSRFLHIAGHFNARQANFEKMALDAQVAPSTIRSYFQILKDTMLGSVLPAWKSKGKLREVSIGKFYLFDTGLARALQGRSALAPGTAEYGNAFEAFIHHELRCFLEYRARDATLHFWRTHSGDEVDFILNGESAIEVKCSANIGHSDLKGLAALTAAASFRKRVVVSLERSPRISEGVQILPWRDFLSELWNGNLCS